MIIPKIKSNFTPLLMAVIIGHFQICNSILLGCFNWPFMILAKVVKGQLISKCLYEVIVWTKIPTKNLIDSAQKRLLPQG